MSKRVEYLRFLVWELFGVELVNDWFFNFGWNDFNLWIKEGCIVLIFFYILFCICFFLELLKSFLGDLFDLKTFSVRYRREYNLNVFGYNYDEFVSLDKVDVEFVLEKKGIILKYNEYYVFSRVRIIFYFNLGYLILYFF